MYERTLLAAAMLMAVTAAPAAAQDQPVEPAATIERTAAGVPVIAPPPAGKGQIVFYRSSRMGFAVNCTVREGEEVLSRLNAGKYFVHVTDPGTHTYRVRSESHRTLDITVEEGQTHYARCSIGAGFLVGRPTLTAANLADFERRGEGMDPMQSREEQVASD